MFENHVRPALTVLLSPIIKILSKFFMLTPLMATIAALVLGVATLPLMLLGLTKIALTALWLSYLAQVMASLLAARNPVHAREPLYDVVVCRIVEFAIVFGFYLLSPGIMAWVSILLLSSSGLATSLYFATCTLHPNLLALYQYPGLVDRLEIFIIFSIIIVFPITYGILGVALAILLLCNAAFKVLELSRQA